jgi:hypothetical protein
MKQPRRPEGEAQPHYLKGNAAVNRRTAEALALELRMLAKRHGLPIRTVQIIGPGPHADRERSRPSTGGR